MVLTASHMLDLGTQAPDFHLPNVIDNQIISPLSYAPHQPLVIAFICNHCPYVMPIIGPLAEMAHHYQKRGVGLIAISSNDAIAYPEDHPEKMRALAARYHFEFPYCYDKTQQVAKAYQAACTPDFYLFNQEHELIYRGQFDASRPGNEIAITGRDLKAAIESLLAGKPVNDEQIPSMGCNIKWRAEEKTS